MKFNRGHSTTTTTTTENPSAPPPPYDDSISTAAESQPIHYPAISSPAGNTPSLTAPTSPTLSHNHSHPPSHPPTTHMTNNHPQYSPYTYPPSTQSTQHIILTPLSSDPQSLYCPHCHKIIHSKIKRHPGLLTYLSCSVIFCFGFVIGCCLVPFCVDGCLDVRHYCRECGSELATYRRL